MDDFSALTIASTGMLAQRVRLRVIAENLANQGTTGPDGPYQRKEVLLKNVPSESFEDALDSALENSLAPDANNAFQAVAVSEIRKDASPPVLNYDPAHPDAGPDGYVKVPNVSIIREMTDMVEASRVYEANLAVNKTTTDMINRAIETLG